MANDFATKSQYLIDGVEDAWNACGTKGATLPPVIPETGGRDIALLSSTISDIPVGAAVDNLYFSGSVIANYRPELPLIAASATQRNLNNLSVTLSGLTEITGIRPDNTLTSTYPTIQAFVQGEHLIPVFISGSTTPTASRIVAVGISGNTINIPSGQYYLTTGNMYGCNIAFLDDTGATVAFITNSVAVTWQNNLITTGNTSNAYFSRLDAGTTLVTGRFAVNTTWTADSYIASPMIFLSAATTATSVNIYFASITVYKGTRFLTN